MPTINAQLTANKKFTELRWEDASGRPVSLPLSASDMEQLIGTLAMARARMIPPVPDKPLPNRSMRIENTMLVSSLDARSNRPVLHVRHPGAGWLALDLAPDRALALAEELREKVAWAARSTSTRN